MVRKDAMGNILGVGDNANFNFIDRYSTGMMLRH
jgi:hypothetical protein